ncbi:MAG: hypothetical protein ACJA02_001158, partial [Myxococcota bacterium]
QDHQDKNSVLKDQNQDLTLKIQDHQDQDSILKQNLDQTIPTILGEDLLVLVKKNKETQMIVAISKDPQKEGLMIADQEPMKKTTEEAGSLPKIVEEILEVQIETILELDLKTMLTKILIKNQVVILVENLVDLVPTDDRQDQIIKLSKKQ